MWQENESFVASSGWIDVNIDMSNGICITCSHACHCSNGGSCTICGCGACACETSGCWSLECLERYGPALCISNDGEFIILVASRNGASRHHLDGHDFTFLMKLLVDRTFVCWIVSWSCHDELYSVNLRNKRHLWRGLTVGWMFEHLARKHSSNPSYRWHSSWLCHSLRRYESYDARMVSSVELRWPLTIQNTQQASRNDVI